MLRPRGVICPSSTSRRHLDPLDEIVRIRPQTSARALGRPAVDSLGLKVGI
ncbi:hypothetical protein AB0C34_21660 [Nocardia sp. NPDC049220]|uniref:hypothetical protein n=1 Tax=Nocardia sp. NPDC049220 TaxID=3155273 RepID=UPI0033EA0B1B